MASLLKTGKKSGGNFRGAKRRARERLQEFSPMPSPKANWKKSQPPGTLARERMFYTAGPRAFVINLRAFEACAKDVNFSAVVIDQHYMEFHRFWNIGSSRFGEAAPGEIMEEIRVGSLRCSPLCDAKNHPVADEVPDEEVSNRNMQ